MNERVEAGEEIIIAKAGRPAARLVPIEGARKLPARVARLFRDGRHQFFYSAASLWEIAIKAARGREDFVGRLSGNDRGRLAGVRLTATSAFLPRSNPAKGGDMPYRSIDDLPKAQTDQYNDHQKKAFLEAFNSAYEKYKDDEGRAFAIAHSAAKRAGERPGPG